MPAVASPNLSKGGMSSLHVRSVKLGFALAKQEAA